MKNKGGNTMSTLVKKVGIILVVALAVLIVLNTQKNLISSDIEDNQQKKRYQPYLF